MEADPVPETLCLTPDNEQVRRNGGIQLVHTSYTATNDTPFHNKDILPNLLHDMQISLYGNVISIPALPGLPVMKVTAYR